MCNGLDCLRRLGRKALLLLTALSLYAAPVARAGEDAYVHIHRRSAADPGTVQVLIPPGGKLAELRINDADIPATPRPGSPALWRQDRQAGGWQLVQVRLFDRMSRFCRIEVKLTDGSSVEKVVAPRNVASYPVQGVAYQPDRKQWLVSWTGGQVRGAWVDGERGEPAVEVTRSFGTDGELHLLAIPASAPSAEGALLVVAPVEGDPVGFHVAAPAPFLAAAELLRMDADLGRKDLNLFPAMLRARPAKQEAVCFGVKPTEGDGPLPGFVVEGGASKPGLRLATTLFCPTHNFSSAWAAAQQAIDGRRALVGHSWHTATAVCRAEYETGIGRFGGLTDYVRINPLQSTKASPRDSRRNTWLHRIGYVCELADQSSRPGRFLAVLPLREAPSFGERAPQAGELRAMLVSAIGHGAAGVLYRDLPRLDDAHLEMVRQANADLRQMAPLLGRSVPGGEVEADKPVVEAFVRAAGGGQYVLCVLNHGIRRDHVDSPADVSFPDAGPVALRMPCTGTLAKAWRVRGGKLHGLSGVEVQNGTVRVLLPHLTDAELIQLHVQ